MIIPTGHEGSIYRERDETSLIRIGNFRITRFNTKSETVAARTLGNNFISRHVGLSTTYFSVEGSTNAPIAIGDKVFFRSHSHQWWGTFIEYSHTGYKSNTFTGQITIEDLKLTKD